MKTKRLAGFEDREPGYFRDQGRTEVLDAMAKCLERIQGQESVWGRNVTCGDALSAMWELIQEQRKEIERHYGHA